MTIEQAWLLVLDYYHDALSPPWQWRRGRKCDRDDRIELDGKVWCRYVCRWVAKEHDIPAPALTDAAALAVLRALNEQTNWDTISRAIDQTGVDYEGDIRDAIILAAAEMAQRERAKEDKGK